MKYRIKIYKMEDNGIKEFLEYHPKDEKQCIEWHESFMQKYMFGDEDKYIVQSMIVEND